MAYGLRDFAEQWGDDWALDDDVGQLSWAEGNDRTNRLINGLRGLGLQHGDTVAIVGGNRREWIEAVGAAGGDGKRWVPVNWHFSPDEIAYVLENSEASLVIADAEYGDKVAEAADAVGVTHRVAYGGPLDGFLSYDDLLASASAAEPDGQVSGDVMIYTSGTTGRPKGVVSNTSRIGADLEEANAPTAMFMEMLGIPTQGGIAYNSAPLYHGGPLVFALVPHSLGSKLVLRRKWDGADALRLIDEFDVTTVYAVPTHFTRLLRLPEATRSAFDGSSLECVFHTAAPCPPDIKRQMIEWWGPVINEFYGASEGGFATSLSCGSEEWLTHPGTVGKPLPMAQVHILDDDGKELGPNETGRVFMRSLIGSDFEFLGDDDKTTLVHKEPGVFTYGDVGHVDEEGFLYLSDRDIDMVISGGVNIYPAEIEGVLMAHPSVADVSVFGVPNDEFGEEVKAAVELVDRADPSTVEVELRNVCREKLAGYMVPRSFEFMELPRTPTGKLPKRLLRAKYWEGTGRTI
ncbi:MAG: AMP-binding protein [Actinomycetota bacterium]